MEDINNEIEILQKNKIYKKNIVNKYNKKLDRKMLRKAQIRNKQTWK